VTLSPAFFAGDVIETRQVELSDGSIHTLHFRQLTVVEMRRFQLAERSDDPDERANSAAVLIAASLVEPDGKPALTLARATQLNAPAADALVMAVLDVHRLSKQEKKASPPEERIGSGTS
jgi:hypothetical protein